MNGIVDGGSGSFQATMKLNGAALPTQPQFSWSTDVASATITPSVDTEVAVISVPAGETATTITVTVTANDTNGKPVTGVLAVPLSAPQVFTIDIVQTA